MDTRTERIVLETARHHIVGNINLPREGYRSRLSDFLNRGDLQFVPLTEVELSALDGGGAESHTFLTVALKHVQLAYPLSA